MMYCCPAKDEPPDWRDYSVVDVATGQEVSDCVEVDTEEGWCRTLVREKGKPVVIGYELKTQRIEGSFRLVKHNAM